LGFSAPLCDNEFKMAPFALIAIFISVLVFVFDFFIQRARPCVSPWTPKHSTLFILAVAGGRRARAKLWREAGVSDEKTIGLLLKIQTQCYVSACIFSLIITFSAAFIFHTLHWL
jgi:hypothetical protein